AIMQWLEQRIRYLFAGATASIEPADFALKRCARERFGFDQHPPVAHRYRACRSRAVRNTLRCERDIIAAGMSATSATMPTTMNVSEKASICALALRMAPRYS